MLIMRRGEVMASGEDIDAIANYAKQHKTKVTSVEMCSALGGFYQLVVRWADNAIGQFWSTDRKVLKSWAEAQPRWPHIHEYSVASRPFLLEMAPASTPDEEDEEEEEPVRIRRRRTR